MSTTIVPCVTCDCPVEVTTEAWTSKEAPMAVCDDCLGLVLQGKIAWPLVMTIFAMRCHIQKLYSELAVMQRQMKGLMDSQADLEKEVLQRKAA